LAERIDRIAPAPAPTIAVVVVLVIRAAVVMALPPARWLGAFVAAPVIGRWTAALLQAIGDPITDARDDRSLVVVASPPWLTAAVSAGVVALAIVAIGKAAIAAVALAAAIGFALGVDAQRRDRGLSAPVVATAAVIGELVALIAATAA